MTDLSDIDPTLVSEEIVLQKSVLELTEGQGGVGFTIGLSLASFRSAEEGGMRLPVTDIVLIALVNILREAPQVFQDEVNSVNTAIADLCVALEKDEGVEEALQNFHKKTGVAGLVRT